MKTGIKRLWREWFRNDLRKPLPRPSFRPRLMLLEERDMPGSLLAVAAALQTAAVSSPAQLSVLNTAGTTAPTTFASIPSPPLGARSSAPVAAPPSVPVSSQIVSAAIPASAPADQNWFLADPALNGQAIFSTSPTDSGIGGAASPLKPSSGASVQNGPMEQAVSIAAAGAQTSAAPAVDSATQDLVAPPSPAPIAPAVVTPSVPALSSAVGAATAPVPASPTASPSVLVTAPAPTTAASTPSAPANNLLPIIAVGSDAGAAPWVKAFDAQTGQQKFQFLAYDVSFTGGVRVASADLNGDGIPDIITAPGAGMAPEIKVFDGKTGVQLAGPVGDFLAYDRSMQGGVFVAAGDVTGDPFNDIIVAPGAGGGSEVRTFSGKDGSLLHSFNAYGPGFEAGLPVAVGNWAGAPRPYVVTGTGPGVSAETRVFDAVTGQQVSGAVGDLHPYGQNFTGGVWVATGDTAGDGSTDLITGAGVGHTPEVKVYDGQTGSVLQDFQAGDASIQTGVRVASTYIAGVAHEDIVTAGGPGNTPQVNVYSGTTGQLLPSPEAGFLAFDNSQRNGLFAAAAIDPTTTVTMSPATQSVATGAPATVTVGWNTDVPSGTSPTTYIYWGDGAATPYNPTAPSGSFTASHAYSAPGTATLHTQVMFTGTGGVEAGGSATATVTVGGSSTPILPPTFFPPVTCSCSCPCSSPIQEKLPPVGGAPANKGAHPIRYADGLVELGADDLSSDGFGLEWGQGRSWSNNPGYAAGGANGNGWVDTRTPHLIRSDGSTDATIIAVGDGNTAFYFDLVNGAYQARGYDQSKLVHNVGANEFVLTDDAGDQFHFADFGVMLAE